MKGPDGRGLLTKEENMSTFIKIADLQRLTERELHIQFRIVSDRLPGLRIGSPEYREALTTLDLIRRVLAQRQAQRPKPGL